ncbi:hypothetical protein ACFV7Q_18060 [Streptomyces sp. NPDC059851]|uniref:hypothetical protein n=1 Tax=Streptomyces sp. NPDC059851 TaxID=3346971 RepID=UPI0036567C2D
MPHDDLEALFSSPAAPLAACPDLPPDLPDTVGGVGREVFTQARLAGAFWSPHPAEDARADFAREVQALQPGALDTDTAGGEAWEHLFAGITEPDVWGF